MYPKGWYLCRTLAPGHFRITPDLSTQVFHVDVSPWLTKVFLDMFSQHISVRAHVSVALTSPSKARFPGQESECSQSAHMANHLKLSPHCITGGPWTSGSDIPSPSSSIVWNVLPNVSRGEKIQPKWCCSWPVIHSVDRHPRTIPHAAEIWFQCVWFHDLELNFCPVFSLSVILKRE